MNLITSPETIVGYDTKIRVFLAGTIDNGNSVDWQQTVIDEMKDYGVTLLNPRRKIWNPNNQDLVAQINWELDALHYCDVIFMYFAPNSLSPISLLELGLFIDKKPMIIVCPKSFYRYINVKVVCEECNTQLYETLEDGLQVLKNGIQTLNRIFK